MNDAAASRRRDESDFAAQEPRQFAADRQSQSGAAVLAVGRTVGLLEGLEDDLLLVGRDADTRVGHFEREDARGAVEAVVVGAPSFVGRLRRSA